MRYPATEKSEIIRLVEQSPLPVRHTLAKLGIPRAESLSPSTTPTSERSRAVSRRWPIDRLEHWSLPLMSDRSAGSHW
jgi:hypothetical protein